jgi:hypothetical protein
MHNVAMCVAYVDLVDVVHLGERLPVLALLLHTLHIHHAYRNTILLAARPHVVDPDD